MFDTLKPQPADKILALMDEFRADPRADKIDLGVGVYRTPEGRTPVMRAVKAAEKRLWETQETKSYVATTGDPAFTDAMRQLILAHVVDPARIAAAAMPGGTGAVRQAAELVRHAEPSATVWLSAPTWPNHPSILRYLGMPMREYRYFDAATGTVDAEGMFEDLAQVRPGDAILVHGCCHNPTGANLTEAEWGRLADLCVEKEAVPFVDLAYQGFGDGLAEDAAGVRLLAGRVPEMMVAASCSKNFGLYRDRAGALLVLCRTPDAAKVAQGTLGWLNRQNFSFPPDHGTRIVQTILADDGLRADWTAELEEIRTSMLSLRDQLAAELRQRTNSDRFDFIAAHRGMFSRLGATPEQVQAMRRDHGVYAVGDSRINIAGLNATTVPILAAAMVDAGM